jgi:copper resistance protein B
MPPARGDASSGARERGGGPPSDARDPDTYAQGLARKTTRGMEMADTERFSRILLDKLEVGRSDAQTGQRIDGFGWYGGDIHRLFVKGEAEREADRLGAVRLEALWDRVFAPFWSTQLGVRRDAYAGPSRNWIAAGIQGLAPYWFDVEVTAYLGEGGRTALRAESSYELFLTQRLILRPTVEAAAFGRDDPQRGIGRGLSNLEAGIRLRYEIRRQFAPYVGVSIGRSLGRTAEIARAAGRDAGTVEAVLGLRLWY